jgi:SAM-dependent methyltransferase
MAGIASRTARRARRALRPTLRRGLTPVRRGATRAVVRWPALGPRLGRHTWLWQPGWSRRTHDRFYATAADPYRFDEPHEQRKYRETLALLEGRRFGRALEVGASQGAFTDLLLDHCEEVVATEVSTVALERARERLDGRLGVSLEQRALPFDFPEGTFDLVVCSDVLYLWEPEVLGHGLDLFARRLRPGGVLLLVHYLGDFGSVMSAARVHDEARRLAPGLGLRVTPDVRFDYPGPHGAGDAGYAADLLVRQAQPA